MPARCGRVFRYLAVRQDAGFSVETGPQLRRFVRAEIGQKPGVVRGTGSSNPSPSSGESANLRSCFRDDAVRATASKMRHEALARWQAAKGEPPPARRIEDSR
jgi:hypothetical protein